MLPREVEMVFHQTALPGVKCKVLSAVLKMFTTPSYTLNIFITALHSSVTKHHKI